jgi:hypothetical protein
MWRRRRVDVAIGWRKWTPFVYLRVLNILLYECCGRRVLRMRVLARTTYNYSLLASVEAYVNSIVPPLRREPGDRAAVSILSDHVMHMGPCYITLVSKYYQAWVAH